jgi:hypothetical protein
MTRRLTAFWLLFAVWLAVYAVMILWSLPTISEAAGGSTPFDLRPGGYSFEEAVAFLTALSAEGRAFYLNVQHRFDLVYPPLLSATLFFAIFLLAPANWGVWRIVLAITALPSAVFDLLENNAVANMLNLQIEGITPEVVAAANRWTVLKGQATTAAAVVMFALLLLWGWGKLKKRMSGRST